MIRKGQLDRESRGIYFDPTYNDFDELYFLQKQFKKKVSFYQIKKILEYQIGIMQLETIMENTVNVYDIEHIICDIIRNRKNQDPKKFSRVWNLYLGNQNENIWKLRRYAVILGISKHECTYIFVLKDILNLDRMTTIGGG